MGPYHTHIYLACSNAFGFQCLKINFQLLILNLYGNVTENRDYILKTGNGKHRKKETNLSDTFEEWGEMPVERQGARNDLADLYDSIKQGLTNFEILEQNPHYMFYVDKIERVRQIVRENQYKNTFRDLEVTYISGPTGCGKTRSVMEKYGYEEVFRVTDYEHPFDSYKGQNVLVFEEFRSSLKISDMLNYLDGYPLELPCRYANKVACFTKVYIISNIDLSEQYLSVQEEHYETWRAFIRANP